MSYQQKQSVANFQESMTMMHSTPTKSRKESKKQGPDIGSFFSPKIGREKRHLTKIEKAEALEELRNSCLNNKNLFDYI